MIVKRFLQGRRFAILTGEAFRLLVMHEMVGSAFALGRPILEGMYRGLWLNVCATGEELKRFNEKDEIRLTLAEMAEAIDPRTMLETYSKT
jgi:hypothetical protein